jgi:uncharacterized protein
MKLHAHPTAELAVTAITQSSLSIAQTPYAASLQVGRAHGVTPWQATAIDGITEADIAHWAAQKPELVVLGTGHKHRFLSPKLAVLLAQNGVGLECMTTPAAARTYNVLLDEGRNVLGAFILNAA